MHSLEHVVFVLRLAVEKGEITQRELLKYLGELMGAVGYEWQPMAGIEGTGRGRPSASEKLNRKIAKRFSKMMYPEGMTYGEDDGLAPPSRVGALTEYDPHAPVSTFLDREQRAKLHCKTIQRGHHIDTLARDR